MQIEVTNDKIFAKFEYRFKTKEKCKRIGMNWKKSGKVWWFNNNYMNRKLFYTEFPEYDHDKDHTHTPMSIFYKPHPKLMQHQKDAIKLAEDEERHLFAHDTGTGKTLVGLELIKQKGLKTLVVCPLSIIVPAWIEDLEKFHPEMTHINLWKWWQRNRHLDVKTLDFALHDVLLVNFETFRSIQHLLKSIDIEMVLIDESSKIKNHKSKITKDLIEFCDDIQFVYLFSGTPAPNTKLEYFSQMRIIDPMLFGKSFYQCRNKYFYSAGYGGYTWLPHKDLEAEFMEKIATCASIVKKSDVLDLPERTFEKRHIQLSPKEKSAYNRMFRDLMAEVEGEVVVAYNSAVKFMKLRQITSGFLINEDEVLKFGKSKLQELDGLLDEIGNRQAIIWSQFHEEAWQIQQLLSEKNTEVAIVNGLITQVQKEINIAGFKSGAIQYLIAHPRSMGHGVTLTNCSDAIYYSLSYSHEEHYQSRDRIYRKGQKNKCTYYYMMVPGSIDKVIFDAVRRKEKIEDAVFSYIKNARRL